MHTQREREGLCQRRCESRPLAEWTVAKAVEWVLATGCYYWWSTKPFDFGRLKKGRVMELTNTRNSLCNTQPEVDSSLGASPGHTNEVVFAALCANTPKGYILWGDIVRTHGAHCRPMNKTAVAGQWVWSLRETTVFHYAVAVAANRLAMLWSHNLKQTTLTRFKKHTNENPNGPDRRFA